MNCPALPRRPGRTPVLALLSVALFSATAPRLCLAAETGKTELKDPYKDVYKSYKPPFLELVRLPSHSKMKLSTERYFFSLNVLHEDSRANALVEAALEREAGGHHREALKMYQIVIDKFPEQLYRVSKYGVFVPVSQYCQRRILGFPAADLKYYRTLRDPRAGETFEQARRKHSLIGLSEVVDNMLATSFGSRAIAELGDAALDNGHYLAALENYDTIRDFFPERESRLRELDLKAALCRRMLGQRKATVPTGKYPKDELPKPVRTRLEQLVRQAEPVQKPFHSQLSSDPHPSTNDYTLFPPSDDPLALKEPVWIQALAGARNEFYVWAQPVVTANSVIYRHRNVVYSRSILNGELRWESNLGGQRKWQSFGARQYPLEDVLVQDGLVFTAMSKGGPSLVALDETTGQLRWAYGPMAAATAEEARMRIDTAPAGGPRAVFAGYVLDNIEGATHTDTEYGIIAFESRTGRLLWRKPICRLAPGKFTAGFAVRIRNRIRSFISPPLYHQGTVYYCTNAGAIGALDARSGRVKWVIRYPYSIASHDASRQYGKSRSWIPHQPMFWFNQPPLLIGERLYVLPIDGSYLMCIDRRTGKVLWSKRRGFRYDTRGWRRIVHINGNSGYLVGALKTGELVFAYSQPDKPVLLVDPKTGATVWPIVEKHKRDWGQMHLMEYENQPSMKYGIPIAGLGAQGSVPVNGLHFELAARPTLSRDGKLYLTQWCYYGWPIRTYLTGLTVFDLAADKPKVIHRRKYYAEKLRAYVYRCIHEWAPQVLKQHEEIPHKDKKIKQIIEWAKKIVADTVPENRYAPFLPFSRMTFRRYGVQFELRFGAREVSMLYDTMAVQRNLEKQAGPQADFAKAELAFAGARYDEAAALLQNCLRTMSSENVDFRTSVNQQLYRVHKRLARSGVRSRKPEKELANCLGMNRTATTLADEMETLFALADAYQRMDRFDNAARCLRSIVSTYGHHEYPITELAALDQARLMQASNQILDRFVKLGKSPWFGNEFGASLTMLRKSLPLYFSTVSPLDKPLTIRAGERATARLIELQAASSTFKAALEKEADASLRGRPAAEQLYSLRQYPGTPAAQNVIEKLLAEAVQQADEAGRRRVWQLADAARVCGLRVPAKYAPRVFAPKPVTDAGPIKLPHKPRVADLSSEAGINWLVLRRRGRLDHRPQLLFVGGRVRKRIDNKFVLACFDLSKGKTEPTWRLDNLRLKGAGQEAGFYDAFVVGDLVITHGLYDVLAFEHATGRLRWRWRVPFNFEIQHAELSGDLLMLSGGSETVALYVHATSGAGEVVWQQSERGDLYVAPYFVGDRFVTVRKNPYNVTVRYRATGRLIGRLELPDLQEFTGHPLVPKGPEEIPFARDGHKMVVTNGWYYLMVDTERLAIDWKRIIDANDASRNAPMRFALNGDYFAVLKQDYDVKTIYMLSSKTGNVMWRTDPKDPNSPQPMHSMFIRGDRIYGIGMHPGQGFYFVGRDCKTGRRLFKTETVGYSSKPDVRLEPWDYSGRALVRVRDRQDFELRVFDLSNGKPLHRMKEKASGDFRQHGAVSATVQNGRLVFMAKDKLNL
jgi:outer membrane protein assembly factor BamB/tetratricopeptide (TPR) repeat protein